MPRPQPWSRGRTPADLDLSSEARLLCLGPGSIQARHVEPHIEANGDRGIGHRRAPPNPVMLSAIMAAKRSTNMECYILPPAEMGRASCPPSKCRKPRHFPRRFVGSRTESSRCSTGSHSTFGTYYANGGYFS